MRIRILRKDIPSYVFLLLLATACLAIGIRMLIESRVAAGTFGTTLGLLLALVPVSLALRKK
ncbi:MAG: hypothetical protein FWE97_01330 [Dehalococcoidia bacterium]|nr:hypothetical protein [Dehalococcoidia bacterium]